MKVGTDSIMLGSWVDTVNVQSILDIGTGSGLLAIMLAQKTGRDCLIKGIDIDTGAIEQARINALSCPWSDRLSFERVQLQSYRDNSKFDLIISNPPYYPAGQPLELQKQRARHTASLTHRTLLEHSKGLLSEQGRLALVLPNQFCAELMNLAQECSLFLRRCTKVNTTINKDISRQLLEFALVPGEVEYRQLVIHKDNGEYSDAYRQLARDFYLHF